MTPDEIIKILRQKGAIISRATLTNYENAKLIPCPERGGFGRGRGRYTNYAEDVAQNVYAIYHMANTKRLTFWALEKIVRNALAFEKKPDQLHDGLKNLKFYFLDQDASMSVVLRDIISPVLRYVCLKEYFCYGVPEQGLEIIYNGYNKKTVNPQPGLYDNGITYGKMAIGDFLVQLPFMPTSAIPATEGIKILSTI